MRRFIYNAQKLTMRLEQKRVKKKKVLPATVLYWKIRKLPIEELIECELATRHPSVYVIRT